MRMDAGVRTSASKSCPVAHVTKDELPAGHSRQKRCPKERVVVSDYVPITSAWDNSNRHYQLRVSVSSQVNGRLQWQEV